MSGLVRRLDLRLGIPPGCEPELDDHPLLQVLIDGQDLLAAAPAEGGLNYGWHPAELLNEDDPLIPADPPRRVALYRSGCGWIECCGCPAPVISAEDGLVIWADFRRCRDFAAAGPPWCGTMPGAGEPAGVPDLWFEAGQYIAEVRRAAAAQEWESDRWRTARLVGELLPLGRWLSTGEHWQLSSVEPSGDGSSFQVTCFDAEVSDAAITAILTPGPGAAEERARAMADFLMATPPELWPRASRFR